MGDIASRSLRDGVIPNQPAFVVLSGSLIRQAGAHAMIGALRREGIGPSKTDEYVFCSREYFDHLRALLKKHACPPTEEADQWECPICKELDAETMEKERDRG